MKQEKDQYIGHISQLFRVEEVILQGGRQQGMRAVNVSNEAGLAYSVVADRCMDITYLTYKGINLSYINPCGVTGPQYYNSEGTNWLKNFTGGFLTTCGLDNVGNPCEDEGVKYGLHGRISNTPAEQFCVKTVKGDKENHVFLSGEMNQASLFGSKLKLRRKICSWQEENKIEITDDICNEGFDKEAYMMLYHFNIGYPFLSPDCEICIQSDKVKSANAYSEELIKGVYEIEMPSMVGERCYFHTMKDYDGLNKAGVFNHRLGIGFSLSYNHESLEHFIQWKNLSNGQYVLGFEPATNYIGGRAEEKKAGRLKKLSAMETVRHTLIIEFYDNLKTFKEKISI